MFRLVGLEKGSWASFGKRNAEELRNESEVKIEMATQLEKDAGFMDKYSRQIGAFGLETMAKVWSCICAFECDAAYCVKRLGGSMRLAFRMYLRVMAF